MTEPAGARGASKQGLLAQRELAPAPGGFRLRGSFRLWLRVYLTRLWLGWIVVAWLVRARLSGPGLPTSWRILPRVSPLWLGLIRLFMTRIVVPWLVTFSVLAFATLILTIHR